MITTENLKSAGYKKYPAPLTKPHSVAMWQKDISDQKGARYFINVYQYSELNGTRTSFQCEVSYSLDKKPFYAVIWDRESIEEVEAFFDSMWTGLKCDYEELIDL